MYMGGLEVMSVFSSGPFIHSAVFINQSSYNHVARRSHATPFKSYGLFRAIKFITARNVYCVEQGGQEGSHTITFCASLSS